MRVQHHDLQRAADAAQIDQSVVVFLEAMKISNLGMLAAAADSFAEVDEQFWQKWCDGIISEEGKELKLTDDNKMTARAALRYLWKEASSSWPQDGHEFADPLSWQRNEGPKQSSPKEMSPEIFQTLVEKYESTTVDGRQRSFPMRLLLGAEKVVNRVWVEHHVTRQYTPLQLHELLECRCFDSSGQLNSLAPMFKTKSPHQKLTLDKDMHAVVMEDEPSWSPKGLLSILDAIEAIQFCWILIRLAHELDILSYTRWWSQLFRSKTNKIEALKIYWIEASWRLALALRQGRDFAAVSAEIMEDTAALQTALTKDTPKPKGSGKSAAATAAHSTTNPRGRTAGAWRNSHSSSGSRPYQRDNTWHRSQPWSNWRTRPQGQEAARKQDDHHTTQG
jgi:hypothetical protein